MMDEPGAIAGIDISDSPVLGPEDINLKSLEMRVNSRDRFLKLDERDAISF